MDQSAARDLSDMLKRSHLTYFSPKSAPQVWGIINRINERAPLAIIARVRAKLHSVKNSTDRYESAAAIQAIKMMNTFEGWLKEHQPETYTQLQRL